MARHAIFDLILRLSNVKKRSSFVASIWTKELKILFYSGLAIYKPHVYMFIK